MIIAIQAIRDGFLRFGRKWSIEPTLVEVSKWDGKGERPMSSKASFVISKAEYERLVKECERGKQLKIRKPTDADILVSEQAMALTERESALQALHAEIAAKGLELKQANKTLAEAEKRHAAVEKEVAMAMDQLDKIRRDTEDLEKRHADALDKMSKLQDSRRKKG